MLPPAHTSLPLVASAFTELLAFGFHAVARPLVASSAAMLFRGWPPAEANTPPT